MIIDGVRIWSPLFDKSFFRILQWSMILVYGSVVKIRQGLWSFQTVFILFNLTSAQSGESTHKYLTLSFFSATFTSKSFGRLTRSENKLFNGNTAQTLKLKILFSFLVDHKFPFLLWKPPSLSGNPGKKVYILNQWTSNSN